MDVSSNCVVCLSEVEDDDLALECELCTNWHQIDLDPFAISFNHMISYCLELVNTSREMKRNQIVSDIMSNTLNGPVHANHNCTMSVDVGGPINMLASNKDSSMIVAAGRRILKLYSVDETSFQEKMNMRVGRRQGLSLSCADVAWNNINENLIATAATNGAIIAWDLSASNRNKQIETFTDHKRTVTKICFHNSEPGRLLSGSQDCTMKMFDIRKKECVSTFSSETDGVRCVQFSPHDYFHFAASFDNGTVQVWDYRNTSSYLLQFIAHKGSVYTIDWHPDVKDKQRIATGGRDFQIKIWDMVDHKMSQHIVIPTNSSVSVARWRAQRREQIASAAMMLDHSINVWDMRRPFMPFAHFMEHKDVTTGIIWKKNDPEILFSCSKDGFLFQHSIRDAQRPSEHCNLSGLAIGAKGHVGHASTDSGSPSDGTPNPKNKASLRFGFRNVVGVVGASVVNQPKSDTSSWVNSTFTPSGGKFARFLNSKSDLLIHREKAPSGDSFYSADLLPTNLVNAAKQYKLRNIPFDELCSHNASVAQSLGMHYDSTIWKHLKVFFYGYEAKKTERSNSSAFHSGSIEKGSLKTNREAQKNGITTTESNAEESEQHSDPETEHYLTDIAKGHATSELDCYYSEDEDFSDIDFMRGVHDGISSGTEAYADQDWLPNEAFQQRLVLQQNDGLEGQLDSVNGTEDEKLVTASPITIPNGNSPQDRVSEKWKRKNDKAPTQTNNASHSQSSSPTDQFSVSPIVTIKPYESPFLPLDRKCELITSMFNSMLDGGNGGNCVQIATCAVIVLGHYFPSLELPIDKRVLEHWQSSYLELVSRYKLWNHHTEIIKLSTLPHIRNMNAASTIHTMCGLCGRRMPSTGPWVCSKHADPDHKQAGLDTAVKCVLCQMVVNSLYVWCQGCCHGGHVKCMKEWFQYPFSKGRCPTGCGHICTGAN